MDRTLFGTIEPLNIEPTTYKAASGKPMPKEVEELLKEVFKEGYDCGWIDGIHTILHMLLIKHFIKNGISKHELRELTTALETHLQERLNLKNQP